MVYFLNMDSIIKIYEQLFEKQTHNVCQTWTVNVRTIFGQSITFYINKTGLVYRTVESIKHYIQVYIKKYEAKTMLLSTSSYEIYLIKHPLLPVFCDIYPGYFRFHI